jgi:ABC-type multidrug transport system fused ATPase/permease subunit
MKLRHLLHPLYNNPLLHPHTGRQLWVYGVTALGASLGDAGLLAGIRWAMQVFQGSQSAHDITLWLVFMVALVAWRFFTQYQRLQQQENIWLWFENHHKSLLSTILFNCDYGALRTQGEFALVRQWNEDMRVLKQGALACALGVQAVIQLIIFIPVLMYLSWQITLFLLIVVAPGISVLQKRLLGLAKPMQGEHSLWMAWLDVMNAWMELFTRWRGGSLLQEQQKDIAKRTATQMEYSRGLAKQKSQWIALGEVVSSLAVVLVFAFGMVLVHVEYLEVGAFLLFGSALVLAYKPAKDASRILPVFQESKNAWQRVQQCYTLHPKRDSRIVVPEHTLQLHSVCFRYQSGSPWVLHNYSQQSDLQKPILLNGPNGSGKTTLLKLIAGLEHPAPAPALGCLGEHEQFVSNKPGIFVPQEFTQSMVYLDQFPVLPSGKYVVQMLAQGVIPEPLRSHLLGNILENLENLKEQEYDWDTKNCHRFLSGGQVQRVALALVIACNAKVWLLDEPFSALPHGQREPLLELLLDYCQRNSITVILSMHDTVSPAILHRVTLWQL